jgi:Rieske Fe-S protein
MNADRPDARPTRRKLLIDGTLAAAGLAWAVMTARTLLEYLRPLARSVGSPSDVVLSDAERKRIVETGFAIVRVGEERVIVLRSAHGALVAASARCPHESCTVSYKTDEDVIFCACHNGKFDLTGRVLAGPPPRPLPLWRASGDLETRVVVSRVEAG